MLRPGQPRHAKAGLIACKSSSRNAEGGTRTPTGCPIRPSNVRVYQFHHFGIFNFPTDCYLGEAAGDPEGDAPVDAGTEGKGLAVGDGVG